ncbi:CbrC family protein [Streptomyces sp. NPDC127084]|uniref:CbrC family protein n=1 Tax=Streptomyces sp. NPDC127084 TaxID=3347133 RepID=UPI0036686BEF
MPRVPPRVTAVSNAACTYSRPGAGRGSGECRQGRIHGVPPVAPAAITKRTPGFSGWQQERRLIHCGDGAAFLGTAGADELGRYPGAPASLR